MTATFNLLGGAKLEILPSKKLGETISKLVKAGADYSQEVHDAAVQCALHIWDNGDTGLAQRLCDELSKITGFNAQGLRKWFGDACPMVYKNETFSLMKLDSDTYAAYVKRMGKMTETEVPVEGQPDVTISMSQADEATGPGQRLFFIGWCSQHPFWTDGAVKASQRQTIRVFSAKNVIGIVGAIKAQYLKAKDNNLVPLDSMPIIDDLLVQMQSLVAEFQQQHAADLYGEEQRVSDFKAHLEAGGEEQQVDTPINNETGNIEPTEPATPEVEVGGITVEEPEETAQQEAVA